MKKLHSSFKAVYSHTVVLSMIPVSHMDREAAAADQQKVPFRLARISHRMDREGYQGTKTAPGYASE